MEKSILSGVIYLSILTLCALTNPAQAQSQQDSKIQILEEKIRLLTQEVESIKSENSIDKQNIEVLKSENISERAEIENVKSKAQQVSDKVSVVEKKIDESVQVSMKPVPKFKHGSFSFQPTGRIHLDYAFFDDDVADHPDGAEFRRARMGVKGQLSDDFGYKIEVDFANEGVNFNEVFINYTGIEGSEFLIGSFRPFSGLGGLTSSNHISFIERSGASSVFTDSQTIGLGGSIYRDNWTFSAALFNDDPRVQSSDDEAISASVRGTVTPIQNDNNIVHLGASARYKKPDQSNDTFDFDSRAENAIQSLDSVEARFAGDFATIYGLEAGVSLGPFHSQIEYFLADVERDGNLPSLSFGGGYLEAGYFLTGEHRGYRTKKGVLGGIKPNRPFSIANNGWGAWQIAARYSTLDLSDEDILGGEMDNYTIGLNWYPNDYMRFMANYIAVDTDENAVTPNDDPNIFLFRSQISF